MQEKNFKNHSRIIPMYHYVLYLLLVAAFAGSFAKMYRSYETHIGGLLAPAVLCIICFILLIIALQFRTFSLKAQDRAIRAEENLRYFAITGNLLDSRLNTQQIIALRFAPNNELLDLAHRAVNENLKPADIKKAVKNWKADYERV